MLIAHKILTAVTVYSQLIPNSLGFRIRARVGVQIRVRFRARVRLASRRVDCHPQ